MRTLTALGIWAWMIVDGVSTGDTPKEKVKKPEDRRLLERLEEPVTLHFKDTPLEEVLDTFRLANARPGECRISIDVNTDGLRLIKVTWKTPVSHSCVKVPLKSALSQTLAPLGLTYEIHGERLLVFAREHRGRWTLLDRRGSNDKIWAKLEAKVDLSFAKTPLEDALKQIDKAVKGPGNQGIPLYIDPVGLSEAGVTNLSPVSLQCKGRPLKEGLEIMLKSLGLVYQVKDGLLTITAADPVEESIRVQPKR